MKRVLTILIIALMLTLLSGCAPPPVSRTVFYMDTVMELTVYGDNSLIDDAIGYISKTEDALSVTDEKSEIYALNKYGSGTLSEETADILSRALELCERTDGKLDITVYPIVRLWGFTTGSYRVPDDSEILSVLPFVDYRKISFNDASRYIVLPNGAELDLGGVAKGYLSDRLMELFRAGGAESAIINLGGNVSCLGLKPDGKPWRVAIKDPNGSGTIGTVEVENKAVVTSGGYERYFEENGETYWHIMDPETGYPAKSGLISVTVIGNDGMTCDALSTALFVMGLKDAVEFYKDSSDFEAIFVTADGTVYITEGIIGSFTPSGNGNIEVISRD